MKKSHLLERYNETIISEGLGQVASKVVTPIFRKVAGHPGTWRRTITGTGASLGAYSAADPYVTAGLRKVGVFDPKTAEAEKLQSQMAELEKRQNNSIEDINQGKYDPNVATLKNAGVTASKVGTAVGVAAGAAGLAAIGLYVTRSISDALTKRKWGISKCKDIIDDLERNRCTLYNNNIALKKLEASLLQCKNDSRCKSKVQSHIESILAQNQNLKG